MQDPIFRAQNPYLTQDQPKKTTPVRSWIYPYSLYWGASLSIAGMSIFYFIQMTSNTNSTPFMRDDMLYDILQLLIEFSFFLLLWWILNSIEFIRRKRKPGGHRSRKVPFQGERGITHHVLLAYTLATALLLIGALWVDFGRMHYLHIFLMLDVALPFLVVLWGPSVLLRRKTKQPPENIKTSFTNFKNYLREGNPTHRDDG